MFEIKMSFRIKDMRLFSIGVIVFRITSRYVARAFRNALL